MGVEELLLPLVTFGGAVNWTVGFLTTVAIFSILALALNTQWGAGILNFGVAAFFMTGAYVSAIFTLDPPQLLESYVGGWAAPVVVGLARRSGLRGRAGAADWHPDAASARRLPGDHDDRHGRDPAQRGQLGRRPGQPRARAQRSAHLPRGDC